MYHSGDNAALRIVAWLVSSLYSTKGKTLEPCEPIIVSEAEVDFRLGQENRTSTDIASEIMPSDPKETKATHAVSNSGGVFVKWRSLPAPQRTRIGGYTSYLVLLTLLFFQPLTSLVLYAAHSYLNSHILLIPFISGYLLYIRRGRFLTTYRSSIVPTAAMGVIGFASLAAGIWWRGSVSANDELTLMTLAYVSFLAAGGFLFLGAKWMSAAVFPIALLIFMVPMPDAMVNWLEDASASASAEAAALNFNLVGTPLVRHGRIFELPGIVLQVAQECSGIHSSLVLFITSLIGSQIFLRTWWGRIALVAFVIPLGILRNGFRILVIGLLCVHVDPQMINSGIHRHGGPIFFALSLIPLFLLLLWLRRLEPKKLTD
jgi:exosortase C (VPDSG-CTERM-specific)